MADLDPITLPDLEDLRTLLEAVARLDMEGIEAADLATIAGDDAAAVVAAANSIFGLVDLVDSQAAQIQRMLTEATVARRPPERVAKQASGSDLWRQRRAN